MQVAISDLLCILRVVLCQVCGHFWRKSCELLRRTFGVWVKWSLDVYRVHLMLFNSRISPISVLVFGFFCFVLFCFGLGDLPIGEGPTVGV